MLDLATILYIHLTALVAQALAVGLVAWRMGRGWLWRLSGLAALAAGLGAAVTRDLYPVVMGADWPVIAGVAVAYFGQAALIVILCWRGQAG